MAAEDGDIPELCPETGSADEDEEGWEEMDSEQSDMVQCLFCVEQFKSISEALVHCEPAHEFELFTLKERHHMDCYSYIKMINFIRTHSVGPEAMMNFKDPLWDMAMYMKPVLENDPWLMYDFEEQEEGEEQNSSQSSGFHVVNSEDGRVTLTAAHFRELQRSTAHLQSRLQEKDTLVLQLLGDLERMRSLSQQLVIDAAAAPSGCEEPLENIVKAIKLEDDEGYFSTYAHCGIHHEMLSDRVRTSTYRDALVNNRSQIEGRIVLDLGCGTGILSMFAASAGAKQVIAVDQSEIIYHAMEIVRENDLSESITLVKGRLEDTELPVDKVDVIVSEWMGYLLLFEGMLDSVVYARDHHLTPGGIMLPNRCTLSLVGSADPERHGELIGFWSDVYGFRMSCLQRESAHIPAVEIVNPKSIATTPCMLTSLDMMTCTSKDVSFTAQFCLEATATTSLTSLVGYFDVFFDLKNPAEFSTGPLATPTHWKQTVFFLEKPVPVVPGQLVKGEFVCLRQTKDARSLKISIELEGRPKFNYVVS